jgi:hypothetical protein
MIIRRTAFLGCLISAISAVVYGQTPFATENLGSSTKPIHALGISAASPWVGAQVAYKFGGTNDFADNLLVSARLLYDIDLGESKIHLPVMGNISELTANASGNAGAGDQLDQKAQQLMMSSTGLRVGLYPYTYVHRTDVLSIIFHGEGAWKMNAFKDNSNILQYLQQGRIAAGIEFGIGKTAGDRLPLTISVTPAITFFSSAEYEKVFGKSKSHVQGLETTMVVPVAQGVGLLLEGIEGSGVHTVRAGLVIATKAKTE